MPYVSDAQRKFMHARHPEIAARWDHEYGPSGKLPEHVKDKKKKGHAKAAEQGKPNDAAPQIRPPGSKTPVKIQFSPPGPPAPPMGGQAGQPAGVTPLAKAAGLGQAAWETSKFVPVAGAIPSFVDAGRALFKGQFGRALLEGGLGTLSLLPGAGTLGRGAVKGVAGLLGRLGGGAARGLGAAATAAGRYGAVGRGLSGGLNAGVQAAGRVPGMVSTVGQAARGTGQAIANTTGSIGSRLDSALARGGVPASMNIGSHIARHPVGWSQFGLSSVKPMGFDEGY